MKKIVNILLISLLACQAFAQADSVRMVKYTPDLKFKEGLYLSFAQLKSNSPIPKSRVIISENINSPSFFDKVLDGKKVFYFDSKGIRQEILTEKIWGFSSNGSIYINVGGNFNRISIIGSICHFIATVTVANQQYYDPFYYGYSGYYSYGPSTYATQETRQFLLNFKTGEVFDYDYKHVAVLIASDEELSNEYEQLSRRKKNDLKFFFIRRFNQRNPLMVPQLNKQ
ncbi:MAG TPA: hypothetical protein VMV56_04305 [Williamwhitmania sp.]|nr:hypothetical protein [Williamwhitmania sp.]